MLFTKGDVKRVSKKALSLLLSVLMVMTSISVCFGTISFAAYDEDPIDYLAEHLKHPVVQYISDNYNYTYSGSAGNKNDITLTTNITLPTWEYYLEARDLLIYLEKAIKSCKEWDYPTKYTDDMQARTCTSAGLIESQILGSLGSVSNAAKEFISFVLEDSRATQHSSANTSQNKVPANHTATVTISTSDIKGYLNSVEGDYTTVQSGFDVSYKYVFKMTRGYYQVSKSSGISKTSYYHNYVKGSDNTNSPVVNGTNTAIKTTVNNYVTNLDAKIAAYDFNTLALMTNDSLDAVLNEVYALRNNIKSDVNSDSYPNNYSKLFPNEDAKIATFEANVEKARELASYRPTADAIKAYQTANPNYGVFNWGAFDEATIKADYATFMNTYRSILEDATLYKFFTDSGVFSAAYIDNFRDNVIAYNLRDTKIAADALYNQYAISNPDLDGDEIELTLGEKQVVYGELSGYINSYNTYTNQVKNAIFPGGIDYLLNLQEYFQCQVDASIIYFAENVNKDYTDVTTEAVIAEIATAKANLAALNALKSSVDFVENLSLLDVPFANADTFIAYLYSLLADRFTTQVTAANDMYNSLGRPNKDLTIAQYSKLNSLVNGIERDIVTFIDGEGKGALITTETRNILAALDTELMPAFTAFEKDRGFATFKTEDMTITREDSLDEFFRENANLDDDMLGEYEVTDENVNNIIDLLEALLKDETIKSLLGDLINKDENGKPTGEAFSLSGLITGLLNDVVFTDELLNTIVQFLYPLVLKEFAKVWAGLPETINVTVENVAAGQNADVLCGLSLMDVESAIEGVGLALGPQSLARALESNATWKAAYSQVITQLKKATIKASYNKENDSFRSPWDDEMLFKTVVDETTGEPVLNEDGTEKKAYDFDWGINKATDKRKAFVDAAVAALTGLEPLLLALLTNKDFTNDTTGIAPRGFKIGNAAGSAKVTILVTLTFVVNVEPITLTLTFDKNDGWDNVLCPIFEALGLTGLKHSEDLQSTRKFLEDGLLAAIDQLVKKLDANPVKFLLDALPNLAYMIDSGMIMPLLNELKTVINYFADAYYETSGGYTTTGNLKYAMGTCIKDGDEVVGWDGINIVIGDMLKDTLPDLSSFSAIWNLLSGVELLNGVEAPDAAYIATLGKLVEKDTNRSTKIYTGGTSGKAYYIESNRADVLQYLVTWVLESGLLSGLVAEPSELIATIFANLENNTTDVVAALVELLNQKAYPAKDYNWFNGYNGDEKVAGKSALNIYMNPNNDWTKEKAEYLYNNLDAILSAALSMAGVDLDLGATIGGAVDGLLTDKTLTSLAALLAKLDLNTLLAPKAEEDADAPEAIAEGDEATEGEAAAPSIDVNALVKSYLGLDLAAVAAKYADIAAAVEADAEYVYDFGVDSGDKKFSAVLADMLAPLSVVLDYLLTGGNLELTVGSEKVTLLGAEGYNNAIVPLLEALGCTVEANPENALVATIDALVARIDALTEGDVIKNIIDLLPGVFYFITSNGLSTAVLNLLQPVLVIVDTIRPVFDVMGLIEGIQVGDKTLAEFLGGELDLENLNLGFVFDLLPNFIDLDLTGLDAIIYDICFATATDYESKSTLIGTNGKKGAYTADFDQADLLTVVLSFVLEWATVEDNAKALDEMLGTNGIIAGLNKVFEDVEITYGTPDWMYWFEGDEAGYDEYIKENNVPNTLASIDWANIGDNDWDLETAAYFAENIDVLVDTIIAMIEINGTKYESLTALVADLTSGLVTAETVNDLVGMIAGLLGDIDENLIDAAGLLLGVDLVGLKAYTCTAEINSISDFINELAVVLDTYAGGLVNFLFFGDDYRFAKKSDSTDTIVINGGLGYEKGLALILEALGCKLPEEATTITVLGALADRVDAILADPLNEVLDLLPNLIYFLNANGLGVAVDNLLQPVYALLDKLSAFGLEVNLADLLKFTVNDKEIAIDLANLSLANVVEVVETLTGLPLDAAEAILVDFATGKITKGEYIYKMSAAREDVITILLVVVLELVSDDAFAAKLDEMLGTDGIVANIKNLFTDVEITYGTPDWMYWFNGDEEKFNEYVDGDKVLTETLASIDWDNIGDNDWDLDTAKYFANNIYELVDTIIAMIEINGTKYEKLSDLTNDLTSGLVTADTVNDIVGMITGLLGDIDDNLINAAGYLLGVDLVGLKAYTCTAEIISISDFIREIAVVLDTYAGGLVNFLFFGDDYRFVKKADGNDAIVINGGLGYEKGLALILEALGCDLPEEATTITVLGALADRVDEILANPVNEVLDLLPNLIYFLNANGFGVAVDNLLQPVYVLLGKLSGFGLNVNIADLLKFNVNGKEIAIDPAELSLANVVEVVETLTDIPLDAAEAILVDFATGKITKGEYIYKMSAAREDVITILLVVVLELVSDDAFAAKLDEMLGTDGIVAGIKAIFEPSNIEYATPEWDYTTNNNGDYLIEYPNNWTEETAVYVTNLLLSEEFDQLVASLIENGKYASIGALLTDKVNVFTSENLQAIVDLVANLLGGIDDKLLAVAGVVLDVDLAGLKAYTVPAGITTVDAFAAELANILSTYAKGAIEWLLLGRDFKLLVKDADGIGAELAGTPYITISGAKGYAEGLALLLEALGCENLPTTGTTEEIVAGVLGSLAARINEIFANPVSEVIDLLPNLIYFLNANGVAAVIENTLAAVNAIADKLAVFGINLNITDLVNLKALMGLEDTDAAISLNNLSMAAVLEAVGLMVGIDLTYIVDVLVGFDLGAVAEYEAVSANAAYKMGYDADFANHDMVTILANLVLITIADEDNAEFVKGLVGEKIYTLIVNLFEMAKIEVPVQDFNWQYKDKADTDYVFSAFDDSKLYEDYNYGTNFTKERADYIADNFGDFVDNTIYLLGLDVDGDGKAERDLTSVINDLLGGSLYNSDMIIKIRDALAGVLANLTKLEVSGVVVGGYIADVLKTAGIADINAVANVEVPSFKADRAQFVASLCDVLEPLYGVLKYLLANEDLSFFVNADKTDAITLIGAEGYANGIIPLLEALDCQGILTPAEYYAAIENGNADVLLTSILNPLLNRVDEIIANPAEEILEILPNLIYFINSNGVDTVVKNTLNAVYTLLAAIKPIAEIDLYGLIGLDLATLNFNTLFDMLLDVLAKAGYEFDNLSIDALAELSIGKLEKYTSLNGKEAYRMVYAEGESGTKTEMVVTIEKLLVTFIMHEKNQEVVVDLLKDKLGMSEESAEYVESILAVIAEYAVNTEGGMDSTLYLIYTVYYVADTGVGNTTGGLKDVNESWKEVIDVIKKNDSSAGAIIDEILGWEIFEDILDVENGLAPNGIIKFFQKVSNWFKSISEWFKNLFSFGK